MLYRETQSEGCKKGFVFPKREGTKPYGSVYRSNEEMLATSLPVSVTTGLVGSIWEVSLCPDCSRANFMSLL